MKQLSESRITDSYIYALLVLFPLFVGFQGYVTTTLSKYVLFVLLTAAWGVWTAVLLFRRRAPLQRAESAVILPLCAYLLLCCISALLSPCGSAVIFGAGRYDGLITMLFCAAAFCAGAFFSRAKKSFFYAAVAAGAISCAIGALQLFGLNPFGLFPADYDYYDSGVKFTSQFFGTIGNADLSSAYLCLLLPLTAAYYSIAKRRTLWLLPVLCLFGFSLFAIRVAAGLLACACTALLLPPVLITNGERLRRALEAAAALLLGAFLALCFHGEKTEGAVCVSLAFSAKAAAVLIIAAFVLFARLAVRRAEFKARPLRIFFISVGALAVLGAAAFVYLLPPESGTLWELSELLHGRVQDSFGSSRIRIWRAVLEIIPERLLLGGGPGTLAQRIDVSFSRYVEETGRTLTARIDNAHNEYLGILANTGLPSLLCYLAAQGASLVLALRRGGKAALCLAFALLCYWIQSFFGLGLFLVSPLMWLCWGLLAHELCKPTVKDAE